MAEPINELKDQVGKAVALVDEIRKEVESGKKDALTKEVVDKMFDDFIAKMHPGQKELTPDEIMKLAEKNDKSKSPTITDRIRHIHGLNVRKEVIESVQKEYSDGVKRGSFIDSAVNKATALAEGTTYYGAEIVIPVYAQNLIQIPPYMPVITGRCYQATLNKAYQMIMPYVTSELSGAWETEAAALDATDTALTTVTVSAKKRTSYIYIANELIEDESYNLDQVILYQAKKDSDKAKDAQILCGTGSPLTGVYSQTGVKTAVASGPVLSFANLLALDKSLDDDYATGNEEYFLRRKCLFDLMDEKDLQGRYVWTPPREGRPATLWGKPYNFSTQVSKTLGDGGDKTTVLLGDPKTLFEVERQPLVIRKADQLRILNDQTVIVTRFRWACETLPNIKGWAALTGLPGGAY